MTRVISLPYWIQNIMLGLPSGACYPIHIGRVDLLLALPAHRSDAHCSASITSILQETRAHPTPTRICSSTRLLFGKEYGFPSRKAPSNNSDNAVAIPPLGLETLVCAFPQVSRLCFKCGVPLENLPRPAVSGCFEQVRKGADDGKGRRNMG